SQRDGAAQLLPRRSKSESNPGGPTGRRRGSHCLCQRQRRQSTRCETSHLATGSGSAIAQPLARCDSRVSSCGGRHPVEQWLQCRGSCDTAVMSRGPGPAAKARGPGQAGDSGPCESDGGSTVPAKPLETTDREDLRQGYLRCRSPHSVLFHPGGSVPNFNWCGGRQAFAKDHANARNDPVSSESGGQGRPVKP